MLASQTHMWLILSDFGIIYTDIFGTIAKSTRFRLVSVYLTLKHKTRVHLQVHTLIVLATVWVNPNLVGSAFA